MPLIFDPTSLNSISNVFQEPHDFLIFTDWVNIYISSRSSQPKLPSKKDWRTFSWSGERRCIDKFLKITEWDLAYLLNTFGDHSLRVFVTGKASLVLIKKKIWSLNETILTYSTVTTNIVWPLCLAWVPLIWIMH